MFSKNNFNGNNRKNNAELSDNYFSYKPGGNVQEFLSVERVAKGIYGESTMNNWVYSKAC